MQASSFPACLALQPVLVSAATFPGLETRVGLIFRHSLGAVQAKPPYWGQLVINDSKKL